MIQLFTLATAVACVLQSTIVPAEPIGPLSVVVTDNTTASLLPPLPKDAKLNVLFRDESEPEEAVHSRAFKLRFATHFVYCSGCESPMSTIYRERLQNHGAVVIDLRTLPQAELTALLKPRAPLKPVHLNGLPLANLFSQY